MSQVMIYIDKQTCTADHAFHIQI